VTGVQAMWRRIIRAVLSRATMLSLFAVTSGGVMMTWIAWANPHPRGLPIGPASTTFLFLFGVAVILEIEHRTRRLRAAAGPAPDPRVVVPIVCRYHGVFLGMHTWIAVAPIIANELRSVRIAVGMVADECNDRPDRLDVVVHAVQ
jgi:hypothetical protein